MLLRFAAATDVGQERDHNEDSYVVDPKLRLFMVADGMGGHAAGEVASQIATTSVKDYLRRNVEVLAKFASSENEPRDVLNLLRESIEHACQMIHDHQVAHPETKGMGTTASTLLIAGPKESPTAFLAHVGDSRIYLFRGGRTHQLTEDHSVQNELIRMGKVTRDSFDESPYSEFRSSVTRALGAHSKVLVDTLKVSLEAGDHFLLCSDGLYSYLEKEKLSPLLQTTNNENVPDELIAIANDSGGHDNITCVSVIVGTRDDDQAQDVIEIVKKSLLGHSLSSSETWKLLGISQVRRLTTGQQLYAGDSSADAAYLILDGTVMVNSENETLELTTDHWVGAGSFFDQTTRDGNAVCTSDTAILEVPCNRFLEVADDAPRLAARVFWAIGHSLHSRSGN